MTTTLRWTGADLAAMPDDGKRCEIVEGGLMMSRQPLINHQDVCGEIFGELRSWNKQCGLGKVIYAPGSILAEDDDVVPDLVWISNERLRNYLLLRLFWNRIT